jgi:uncharacterized protein involved in type VI secretion and phage assembly
MKRSDDGPTAFHGIYRGVVMSAADSLGRGRVQVQVPEVSGQALAWALPCQPVALPPAPKVGSGVWVMFEGGDPSRPVWMGVLPDLPV